MLIAKGLLGRFQGKGTFVRRTCSILRCSSFSLPERGGEWRILEGRILQREVMVARTAVAKALRQSAGAKVKVSHTELFAILKLELLRMTLIGVGMHRNYRSN